MKKILLAGSALFGIAALSTPAQADLKLDLGGYFRGYAVYSDNDEISGSDDQQFEFRRDTEVHFTGETTTDSGLTVGFHSELKLGGDGATNTSGIESVYNATPLGPLKQSSTDEAYAYFSGGWGRVNFGSEDGAAYLLQVAAPSADSNIDGLRVYVQSWDQAAWFGFTNGGNTGAAQSILGYDNADFKTADRMTYLTPKWNGFQAGISYAPNAQQDDIFSATNSPVQNTVPLFNNIWEASARWDGEYQGFGISFGGGYSHATSQRSLGLPVLIGSDDLKTWDAGLNVSYQDFSLGVAYKTTNTGVETDGDVATWVVGAAWDNGPYHLGASWADFNTEDNSYGAILMTDLDRLTVGGGYTYGPGMTFRGSVAYLNVDSPVATAADSQYQIAIGTDINF